MYAIHFVLFHLCRESLLTTYVKLFPANLLHKAMLKACRRPIIVTHDEEREIEREREEESHISGRTTSIIIENQIALSPLTSVICCKMYIYLSLE